LSSPTSPTNPTASSPKPNAANSLSSISNSNSSSILAAVVVLTSSFIPFSPILNNLPLSSSSPHGCTYSTKYYSSSTPSLPCCTKSSIIPPTPSAFACPSSITRGRCFSNAKIRYP